MEYKFSDHQRFGIISNNKTNLYGVDKIKPIIIGISRCTVCLLSYATSVGPQMHCPCTLHQHSIVCRRAPWQSCGPNGHESDCSDEITCGDSSVINWPECKRQLYVICSTAVVLSDVCDGQGVGNGMLISENTTHSKINVELRHIWIEENGLTIVHSCFITLASAIASTPTTHRLPECSFFTAKLFTQLVFWWFFAQFTKFLHAYYIHIHLSCECTQ